MEKCGTRAQLSSSVLNNHNEENTRRQSSYLKLAKRRGEIGYSWPDRNWVQNQNQNQKEERTRYNFGDRLGL